VNELSLKTTRGMLWSLAENFGLQAMQFVVSIILARLLLPEQFGLIGMVNLFIVIAQTLTIGGFGSAFIQKKDASNLDACSIFYFNMLIGFVLTGVLFFSAPLISQFYQQPILLLLTRVLAFNILINALSFVPNTMLTKRMDFKPLVKVNVIAVILSSGVSITLAVNGFGVWSIVAQSMLYSLVRSVLIFQASHWYPTFVFSGKSLSTMFPFGSRMLLSGLLDAFFQNIYQPLIGKMFSAADLGFYTRAQTIQNAFVQPTVSSLWRVMFPGLAEIQDDTARMNNMVRKTMETTVIFFFPVMIGLILIAEPLIILLMTNRWAPSIPYFRLFCIAGLFFPLDAVYLSIFLAIGRSKYVFRIELARKILIILSILITYRWGITALLVGQVLTAAVIYSINSFYSGKIIHYLFPQQMRDIMPALVVSILMGMGMYLIGSTTELLLPRLIFQLLTGMTIFLSLTYLINRPAIMRIADFARSFLPTLIPNRHK
jgi:teichuronic acid exporter